MALGEETLWRLLSHLSLNQRGPADGDALRDDQRFACVAAWEYAGENKPAVLHKEPLTFEHVEPSKRSYK